MIKIMFVCLGNICRSPMAEFIFKHIAAKRGGKFDIASSATSGEEEGNSVYPPAAGILAEHGINCSGKRAVKFTAADYEYYDYVVCMESVNVNAIRRITNNDPLNKVSRLLDFSDNPRDISDPWYTRDFETAYSDIYEGCTALYDYVTQRGAIS